MALLLRNRGVLKAKNKLIRLVQPPTPLKVKRANIAITYACDGRCRMCNIWRRYRENPEAIQNELSFDEIAQAFEGSNYLRFLDEILITGGEPFLRMDLFEIFQYLALKYPSAGIVISTNGIDTERIIEGLKRILSINVSSRLAIIFSVDGIGKTHDKIRGIKGAYEKTLDTIREVKTLAPEITLGSSFTITQENYQELMSVYELSRELDVGFTMRFAASSENFYAHLERNYHWSNQELTILEDVIKKIISDISNNRNIVMRLFNPDTYFFSKLVDYQRNPRRMFCCYSGTHSFFLDPYGDVYPCIYSHEPSGNIRDTPFDEIWLDSKAQKFRELIKDGKCHCWSECEVLPSLQRKIIRR